MLITKLLLVGSLIATLSACIAERQVERHWTDDYVAARVASEHAQAQREAQQARARSHEAPYAIPPARLFAPPPLPDLPPQEQNWMLRTPSGDLYWKTGSTVWGPDGPYTIY